MNNDLQAKYDAYIRERTATDSASLEMGKHYDTWFLTLSGGALLLSVTFVEKIAPHPAHYTLWFLAIGWLLLAGAIGCQLWAVSRTTTGLNQKILLLDYEYSRALTEAGVSSSSNDEEKKEEEEPGKPETFASATRKFNSVAFWSFIFGLFFLALFSVCNIAALPDGESLQSKGSIMGEKKPLNESRGTYVPSPIAKSPPPQAQQPSQPPAPSPAPSTPPKANEPPKQ